MIRVIKGYVLFILVSICAQQVTASSITLEQLAQFKTDGLGRVCILDTHHAKWSRAWSYYPDRNRTESLRIHTNLALMRVVHRVMRSYEVGKALKIDKKFITRLGELGSGKPLVFGRDAYIGRALQAMLGLLDDYTDPLAPGKEGHFFIDEYKRNFIMCLQFKSHDDLAKLMAYFQSSDLAPAQTRPLLIVDIADDKQLEYLSDDERAFLDAYFTWDNFNTNDELQTFVKVTQGQMRALERDVEDAKPKYIEGFKENVLRSLESVTGNFELDRPQMWLIILGALSLFREPICTALRNVESIDSVMNFLHMPWGKKKYSEKDVVEKLNGVGLCLVELIRGQRAGAARYAVGAAQQVAGAAQQVAGLAQVQAGIQQEERALEQAAIRLEELFA